MINVENLPCAFKRSVEERAVDELLALSEQCWTPDYKNIKRKEVLQESKEDLSSLTYKMLVIEDDTSCSSCKTPLAPWQVCVSTKEHEGGYILDPQSLDALAMNRAMASRKNPQIFTPARCCCNNFTPKDDRNEENSCAERDSVKDTKPKSSPFADQQAATNNIQDGGRLNRNASFPHAGFKFYHTEHTDFYINSYRKQVTDHYIRKHIQWRIRENNINAVKRPPKKLTQEVKSKTIPKPSFTFYSFRISKKSSCDNGVLKIGPCPRHLPEQNDSKKARFSKIKTQSSIQSTAEKTMEPQKESKPLIMTNLAFQSSPLARTDNTMIISGLDRERNVNDAPKTESSDGKLKKVQLKVDCPTESPRIVARGRANKSANKCKARLLGVCTRPMLQCYKSSSEISYERKVTRKPTFGEKEFLRITTPKPLIHCQSLSKTPSDFGESPGFSPDKSVEVSPMRSPVPSVSGTSLRSQVIAEILMKREPQAVFPKNSNFQACITPSNYSTSSVESHIRHRKNCITNGIITQDLDEEPERNCTELPVQRMPSKPSIPKIGPFISG